MVSQTRPPVTQTWGTRPEHELLLCCTRTARDEATAKRIQALLQSNLDWDYLIAISMNHRVMPLLYRSLSETYTELVPKPIFEKLQDQFCANVGHNLSLASELLKTLELFAAHDIPAIPFKGPFLAASAYGNVSLRQSSDLDILIQKQDILRAKNLLFAKGYQIETPSFQLSNAQEILYIERKHEYAFQRDETTFCLEIQWTSLDKRFSVPLQSEQLWSDLRKTQFLGATVTTPSSENLILLLCLESYKEYWRRLNRICDVAEFIRTHSQLNWALVLEKARTLRIERILFINLALSRNLLGLELPEYLNQNMQVDPKVKLLSDILSRWLFEKPQGGLETFQKACFPLIHLAARKSLQDKIKICLFSILPNEKDWELLPLPSRLNFLYYLIRPIRLSQILLGYLN